MGQAPGTGQVSLHHARNFPGRLGAQDDRVFLCSPETGAAAAIKGVITDPRDLGREAEYPRIEEPKKYLVDDVSIIRPSEDLRKTEVIRGPNIVPLPALAPLPESLETKVVLVAGDNISTDTIMPAGSKVLPLRSNIPAISQFVFSFWIRNLLKNAKRLARLLSLEEDTARGGAGSTLPLRLAILESGRCWRRASPGSTWPIFAITGYSRWCSPIPMTTIQLIPGQQSYIGRFDGML